MPFSERQPSISSIRNEWLRVVQMRCMVPSLRDKLFELVARNHFSAINGISVLFSNFNPMMRNENNSCSN
jgi:hypothetical protein